MSNVITGTTGTFGSDPLWAEDKVDDIGGLDVSDLPTRAVALYPNEIDKQFKFINTAVNGKLALPGLNVSGTLSVSGSLLDISGSFGTTSGSFYAVTASLALLAGAEEGDGVVGADDLVIGDGSGDHGLTIHCGDRAIINMTDSDGAEDGSLSYQQAGGVMRFTTAGVARMRLDADQLRPWTDEALELGSTTHRWTNVNAVSGTYDKMYLSGAEEGDGPAGADDLVLGDGSGDHGLTIHCGDRAIINMTDSAGVEDGSLSYQQTGGVMRFTTAGAARMRLDANELRPWTDEALELGSTTHRWTNVHAVSGTYDKIYIAGAEEGDEAPNAGDLVIGDGSASPGMTLYADANGVGRYAITDLAGAQHGELRYDLDLARWQFEANGTHVANMNSAAIWPNQDDDIALGTSNLRWSNVHGVSGTYDKMYLAGAESGDADSSADDLVIGDGSGDSGMTIFSDGTSDGKILFTDVAGAQFGGIVYEHNTSRLTFRAGGTNRFFIDSNEITPQIDDSYVLGRSSLRYSDIQATTGSFSAISGSSQAFIGSFGASNEDPVFVPFIGTTDRTVPNSHENIYYTSCNVVVESITLRTSVTGDHAVGIYNLPGLSGAPDEFLVGHITQSIPNGNPPQTIYIDGNPNLSGSNHVPLNRAVGIVLSGTTGAGYTIRLRHDWTT